MLNQYEYIEQYGKQFSEDVAVVNINHFSVAHADKCYGYRRLWEKNNVPFNKGVMIYLLSYLFPYSDTVRETVKGWVSPDSWVIDQYKNNQKIREALNKLP
jgi:hypothetical protein